MIEFEIRKDGVFLGSGEVEESYLDENGTKDYIARIRINKGGGTVGMHQHRLVGFDPNKHNALGLVRLALESLAEEVFEREPDAPEGEYPGSPDANPQAWMKRLGIGGE